MRLIPAPSPELTVKGKRQSQSECSVVVAAVEGMTRGPRTKELTSLPGALGGLVGRGF